MGLIIGMYNGSHNGYVYNGSHNMGLIIGMYNGSHNRYICMIS